MQYDEFVQRVQDRSGLESRDAAERLITVTLEVLAEPLSRDETNLLASQLPGELKRLLLQNREEPIPAKRTMRSYEVEEFNNRVKARLKVSYAQGADLAQSVTGVLAEAVTDDVIDTILKDLPESFVPLFR